MSYGFVISAVDANAAIAAHTAFKGEHEVSASKLKFPLEFAEKLFAEVNYLTSPHSSFREDYGLSGAISGAMKVSGHTGPSYSPAIVANEIQGAKR